MTKTIFLSQSKLALVDDDDFEWLNQWNWTALNNRANWYAVRSDNGEHLYMHRVILNTPSNLVTHHFDHDGLNNQRFNLVSCTQKQHRRYHQPRRDARANQLYSLGVSMNLIRVGRDISVKELALLAGVSEQTIYGFERGAYAPTANTLNRLRKALPGYWPGRSSTQRMKTANRGHRKRAGKTSRYVGVSWSHESQCWRAEIRVNYKLVFLGRFDSEEEAARVWNAAALKHRGTKARVNEIIDVLRYS